MGIVLPTMRYYTNVTRYKNKIFHKYVVNGIVESEVIDYRPKLYVDCKANTGYKSYLTDRNIREIEFDSIYEASKYVRENNDLFDIHGNTYYESQFINEKYPVKFEYKDPKIVIIDIETSLVNDSGVRTSEIEHGSNKITAITVYDYDSDVYNVFGMKGFDKNNLLYIKVSSNKINYIQCKNEKELLTQFLIKIRQINPDVYSGWNIGSNMHNYMDQGFDILVLVKRIEKILGKKYVKYLSPEFAKYFDEVVEYKDYTDKWGNQRQAIDLKGVALLDGLMCFRKFPQPVEQESYKLDHIAYVVLGERKVDYSEYKDLEELYNNDHQQYIEYNIHDVDLVKQILDKLKILQFLFALAYKTKTRFTDISSAVRIWTSYLSYVLYDRGVILPVNKHNNEKTEKFSGAVVFDPQVGKFDWVAVYDINSLYPNLITSLNIDHKALISKGFLVNKFGEDNEDVKYLFSVVNEDCRLPIEPHDILNDRIPERLFTSIHNLNICLAGNGYFFDSSKESLFAELMNLNYSERKEFQKEKTKYEKLYKETNDEKYNLLASAFNVKQLGTKIFINSFFGFLGNPYGSLYDLRLAEAITLTGQVVTTHSSRVINKTINNVTNKNHNYIVGADTDSNMFFLKDVISTNTYEEQLNESIAFCNNVITPALRNGFDDLKNHLNFMTNKIKMDMEALASSAFFRAKKNYAMNVVYSEGVVLDKPKLKIKGLEAVKRSAFPEYTRNAITEIIKIILTQTEENAREFIRKVKVDFFNEKAYNIASPRGVGDFEKYIGIDGHPTKGAQAHIKGCILYNRLTEPYRSKYKRIHNGDKIKFLPLIKENPYGYNCLAFIEDIPEEIGIRNYIDIESHYKKTFLNVVQSLLDVVKWKHEKGNYNLFSFTEE